MIKLSQKNWVVFSLWPGLKIQIFIDLEEVKPRHEKTCFLHIKGTDQLHVYLTADQHRYFRYIDKTIHLLPKFQAS